MRVTVGWIEIDAETVREEATALLPGSLPDELVQLALAVATLVLGWYLSKVVVRVAGRTIAQRIERPSVTRTVLRGIRVSVLTLAVIVAISLLGVRSPQILVSVGVISAVIAVVLAPLIGSFINGVFIISDRPFEIGDMIEIADEGHTGFVEDITIRYTKIFTLENTLIVIPNSEIHTRDVINYSAEDERTRLSVQFDVTYESDIEAARNHAVRAARSVDAVISGGPAIRIGSARYGAAPICDIVEYGDDGVRLQVRFWVERPYTQTAARSNVLAAIGRRFEKHDIEFAYPHTHHVFDETSGIARMTLEEAARGQNSPEKVVDGSPAISGDGALNESIGGETTAEPADTTSTDPDTASTDPDNRDESNQYVWAGRTFILDARSERAMYDTVLVPTDGSDTVPETLTHAASIAADTGATLHGLYVIDTRITAATPAESRDAVATQLEREGEAALADVEATAAEAGLDAVTALEAGTPSKAILEYATEAGIDLIVIGTHGKSPREKVTGPGSVSDRVVGKASIPVLVVPNAGEND